MCETLLELAKGSGIMDSLDYQILSILKKNARIKASDISKEIHLSVSTVIERIHKLENSGIIESYTIITDEHKMGNDLTALMEISLTHPRFNDSFIEKIMEHPNIISCYYLTGDFDYLVKICCRSSEHLEQIHKWVKDQRGVRSTRTQFVLRNVKNIYTSLPEPSPEDNA